MKKSEMNPGQITATKQVKDRVSNNVSTRHCIILPEKDTPRQCVSDSSMNRPFLERVEAYRPSTEDEIRALGQMEIEQDALDLLIRRRGKTTVMEMIEVGILVVA